MDKTKKRMIVHAAILAAAIIILYGCSQAAGTKDTMTLGYCPTMAEIAGHIESNNPHVTIVPFDYTAAALNALNQGDIDAVLVGRIAGASELSNAHEIHLREGLTLIGAEKRMILESELQKTRIHTYVSIAKAREFLPEATEIVYHESFETAVDEGLDELVLIDWQDYSDEHGLVIPVDMNMNKVERFRIPVLYSFNQELIEDLML